ncbi:MAG: cyanophycinase [Chitinophagaceae bacterium]|nr:MAG: cyanophycinase [Chitinophagaceae bacterium]
MVLALIYMMQMKKTRWLLPLLVVAIFSDCSKSIIPAQSGNVGNSQSNTDVTVRRPASVGIIGDTANVNTTVESGLVLMGGGTDVDAAYRWMIARSGGGDVVVIRASGTNAYNPYISKLGAVNSVETLKIDSRELANNDTVANIIRNAEMLFIAGGDQSNYMKYWRGTQTEAAINYLLKEKKAPVGGTSAGCAILGGFYYSGENGSVVSADALQNPYHTNITLYNNDFLKAPYLQSVITDQHYLARTREGRSVVFLARILNDWQAPAKAIAVDERTAVCIDKEGKAKVFGLSSSTRPYSYAYFIATDQGMAPEHLEAAQPMQWKQGEKALSVYEIQASETGNGHFNVASFSMSEATGGKPYWWWVDKGILHKNEQ